MQILGLALQTLLGVGSSFDIDALPDLVAAYEADDTFATGLISTWPAHFGVNDLTNGGGSVRPTKVANSQNGLPTINFDGIANSLSVTANWWNNVSAFTIFCARKINSASGGPVIYGGDTGQDFHQQESSSDLYTRLGGAVVNTTYTSNIGNFDICCLRYDGNQLSATTQLRHWTNGVEDIATASSNTAVATQSNTSFFLGSLVGSFNFCNMDVGSFRICSSALDPTIILQACNFYKAKWGIL